MRNEMDERWMTNWFADDSLAVGMNESVLFHPGSGEKEFETQLYHMQLKN